MKKFLFSFLVVMLMGENLFASKDVIGNIYYNNNINAPIPNVTIQIKGMDNPYIATTVTGINGGYNFPNVPNGKYLISGVSTTLVPTNEYIDLIDVFLIYSYLMGYQQFTPLQLLVADVNADKVVNWNDFYYAFMCSVGWCKPLNTWRFTSEAIEVSDLKSSSVNPAKVVITDHVPSGLGGGCSGDVGGVFVPVGRSNKALVAEKTIVQTIANDQSYSVSVTTLNPLSIKGAAIVLNFPANLVTVESVDFNGKNFDYKVDNGQIRLIWGNPDMEALHFNTGDALLTIHGKTTNAFNENSTALFTFDGVTNLMSAENQPVQNLRFASATLKLGKGEFTFSNYPNPCNYSTVLNFYNPSSAKGTVEVYDAIGRLVKTVAIGLVTEGKQQFTLNTEELKTGSYICRLKLESDKGQIVKSIRLVKSL